MAKQHHEQQDYNHNHPQDEHDQHQGHNHGDHDHSHHHEEMVEDFKRRFYVSLVITIPILILSPMIQSFLSVDWRFVNDQYILFILSTLIFFYGGWPFVTGAVDELKQKEPGMMTLIALAIFVAYVYSAFTVFGLEGNDFFWELATLIDIMLLGHWIEMKSVMGASNALEALVKLMPNEAHKVDDNGNIFDVSVSSLQHEDRVLVKPGEKVPVDGTIIDGSSAIDESMLTGESIPVEKHKGESVICGSMNKEGSLTITVEKIGDDTYLSQVITLVREAQKSKSRSQDLTNKAAKWLFYIALLSGIVTLVIWLLLGYAFDTALERMVTVMVITCPHALGLAAPLVVAVSTSIAAKHGLLIRNRAHFEGARNVNAVVFDKTGTLTKGEFGVTDVWAAADYEEQDIIHYAASLEQHSEHPIATGIVQYAKDQSATIEKTTHFESITGKGIQGEIDGKKLNVVSPGYVKNEGLTFDEK